MAQTNEVRLAVLAGQKNYHALRAALGEMNVVDVAQFIEDLPEEQAILTFRTLQKEQAMDVFAELPAEAQQFIIEAISDRELGALMDELAVDDAVDMLEEMPATLVRRVLQNASADTRTLINQFLLYPENSAGSIMTAEYTDLKLGMTVEDAIKRIRRVGENKETIYTCYVTDPQRLLLGVVTVKNLLLAADGQLIDNIMEPAVISAATTTDQEAVAHLMAKYDLMALPIVDGEKRLVGIVTVDDAVDVIQEEATEDFEKMAAMAPSEKPYLKTGVFSMARNRILWLLILMLSGMLSGGIITSFEAALVAAPLLMQFIPMLTDTGGNAGSQSSTLVIRGMALGEIAPHDALRVLWKELRVSFMVAIPLAAINVVRVVVFNPGNLASAFVISAAMVFTVVLANCIGGLLPIGAKLCRIDPAVMAAPLITTLVDACSLVIYFAIAILVLQM